jgi:hypothetical protein
MAESCALHRKITWGRCAAPAQGLTIIYYHAFFLALIPSDESDPHALRIVL